MTAATARRLTSPEEHEYPAVPCRHRSAARSEPQPHTRRAGRQRISSCRGAGVVFSLDIPFYRTRGFPVAAVPLCFQQVAIEQPRAYVCKRETLKSFVFCGCHMETQVYIQQPARGDVSPLLPVRSTAQLRNRHKAGSGQEPGQSRPLKTSRTALDLPQRPVSRRPIRKHERRLARPESRCRRNLVPGRGTAAD